MKKFIVVAFLLLAACNEPAPGQMQDGKESSTPPQWTEYCQTAPHDEACLSESTKR